MTAPPVRRSTARGGWSSALCSVERYATRKRNGPRGDVAPPKIYPDVGDHQALLLGCAHGAALAPEPHERRRGARSAAASRSSEQSPCGKRAMQQTKGKGAICRDSFFLPKTLPDLDPLGLAARGETPANCSGPAGCSWPETQSRPLRPVTAATKGQLPAGQSRSRPSCCAAAVHHCQWVLPSAAAHLSAPRFPRCAGRQLYCSLASSVSARAGRLGDEAWVCWFEAQVNKAKFFLRFAQNGFVT